MFIKKIVDLSIKFVNITIIETSATSGEDNLGRWQSTTFFYALFDDPRTTMEDSIITYTDFPIVRFRQVNIFTC